MKELGVTTLELMPVTEFHEVREETEVRDGEVTCG